MRVVGCVEPARRGGRRSAPEPHAGPESTRRTLAATRPHHARECHVPSCHARRAPRQRLGVAPGQGRVAGQRDSRARGGRAARRRRDRLRGHRHPAARERAARRPRRHLPRRARARPRRASSARSSGCSTSGCRSSPAARSTTTRTTRSRSTPACSSPSAATRPRSSGCTATAASARSSPRPTRRSPTSSARSTRSRSPRAATSPTSSRSTTASCRAPTAASSRSTSFPTSPSASRSACSTCSRSATCRSAATRSASRSTCMLVASANPEDYTNRGRIITPLKDRFGAQIRTHYPLDDRARGRDHRPGGPAARRRAAAGAPCPTFMTEIVAEISQHARRSPHVNQRSGVSARLVDRQLRDARRQRHAGARSRNGEREVVPAGQRPRRAGGVAPSGKVEIEIARRRPRGAGARPHRQERGARGVPRPGEARAARAGGRVVRGRLRGAHRRGRRLAPTTRSWSTRSSGLKPLLADLEVGESPAGVRLGHRVRARGPAPLEAPQQGRASAAGPPTAAAASRGSRAHGSNAELPRHRFARRSRTVRRLVRPLSCHLGTITGRIVPDESRPPMMNGRRRDPLRRPRGVRADRCCYLHSGSDADLSPWVNLAGPLVCDSRMAASQIRLARHRAGRRSLRFGLSRRARLVRRCTSVGDVLVGVRTGWPRE